MVLRRGVGVAHVQQKQRHTDTMADFGASMSAERIGMLSDQLDDLKRRLRELTQTHVADIERDAIVRSKFRQLATALGVDYVALMDSCSSSSQRTAAAGVTHTIASTIQRVAASALHGKDVAEEQRLAKIAAAAVDVCIAERRYWGAVVPLDVVVAQLRRRQASVSADNGASSSSSSPQTATAAEVQAALKKLAVFGTAYSCVNIDGVVYIQTAACCGGSAKAGASRPEDTVALLAFVRKQVLPILPVVSAVNDSERPVAFALAGALRLSGLSSASRRKPSHTPPQQSAGPHADASADDDLFPDAMPQHFSHKQLLEAFPSWSAMRLQSVLQRLLMDGTVWVDDNAPSEPVFWFLSAAVGGCM